MISSEWEQNMKAAVFGLGKMGANMARRLIRGGHQIIGYDRSPEITRELAESENLLAARVKIYWQRFQWKKSSITSPNPG